MPRLSDRAFHIVKTEIERRYTDDPADQIERVILLARLETLRAKKGAPMTRVQIWEVLSDIAPNFDQNVLMDAESVETDSPFLGASIGVGAVAVLVATAVGMDALTPMPAPERLLSEADLVAGDAANLSAEGPTDTFTDKAAAFNQGLKQGEKAAEQIALQEGQKRAVQASSEQANSEQANSDKQIAAKEIAASTPENSGKSESPENSENSGPLSYRDRFWAMLNMGAGKLKGNASEDLVSAKALGWQAALRSQEPPYSAQYWQETAAIWEQAIAHLDKIPSSARGYDQIQLKKAEYQDNLKEVKSRQTRAQRAEQVAQAATLAVEQAAQSASPNAIAAPKFLSPNAGSTVNNGAAPDSLENSSENASGNAGQAIPDPIKVAREYGWQAAVASQNAPHPPEKWADISRLWQRALSSLNQVEPNHPRYAEAQQVKVLYESNLSAIRDRYQREQAATQRLQSLRASLSELNNSLVPDAVKYGRMEAILERLKTIPAGTEAHLQAQQLIADMTTAMNAIASVSSR